MSHDSTGTARRAALPLLFTLLLVGCRADPELEARLVLSHDQCHGVQAGLTRVTWEDVAAIRGSQLLGMTGNDRGDERGEDLLMVAISRGEQPTAGYAMRLEGARREPNTAVIDVHWIVPPPDAMVAQVITHPCLVVGLTEAGMERVLARDQHGTDLGEVEL
jgi:hypothetical protein